MLQIIRLVQDLEERIRGKRQKVEALQAGKVSGPQITAKKGSKQSGPMSLELATQQFNLKRKAWVERKSLCMNAVDVLSEALSKKRQEILVCDIRLRDAMICRSDHRCDADCHDYRPCWISRRMKHAVLFFPRSCEELFL